MRYVFLCSLLCFAPLSFRMGKHLSFFLLLFSFISGNSFDNINYACSKVDCQIIQKGCPCFNPDNLINHASIAMNLYYQSMGRNVWNCDFKGSGLIVISDPSYGNCLYA
ncbi:hypothetical protein E1A91_A04G064100v1 [Gossypium mustelinum]|uniref:X8 domain-containing protein n=1 Tax=Gossypium mustelinum TaxID=34275 RepID=A0A5D2ZL88_GOSMU|nr:hypothetical protein E1A91_A04G064100v1 [Gossypium mustelinum]